MHNRYAIAFLTACSLSLPAALLASQQPGSDAAIAQPGVEQQDMTPAEQKALADANRRRLAAEKVMHAIRREHFGSRKVVAQRQAGIAKLSQFTDPASFPALLSVFRDEERDVRDAIVNHLAAQGTPAADSTLAWIAVYERDEAYRDQAASFLKNRRTGDGEAPGSVKSIIAAGLGSHDDAVLEHASDLAHALRVIEAIPMMINAQVQLPTTSGAGAGFDDGSSAIAYIYVARQRAFIADLTPVVGDSSVGFDPTPGVVTEGTVLKINDAAVTIYRGSVHRRLVAFTSELIGHDTASLGWDRKRWGAWYQQELLPALAQRKAQTPPEAVPEAPVSPPGGG